MKSQLSETVEEIISRNFEEEATLLQNDKATEILLKINEYGTISRKDLLEDDEGLRFLLKYGFVLKKGEYFLAKKGIRYLTLLGIKTQQKITHVPSVEEKVNDKIFNYEEIKKIPEDKRQKNLIFENLNDNIFIKKQKDNKTVECLLLVNCISDLHNFFSNLNNNLSNDCKLILYYQTIEQRKNYLFKKKNLISSLILKFALFISRLINDNKNSFAYSKAEILGRLVFNGFRIVEDINHGGYNSVVLLSENKININKELKYSPIIKLNKLGKNGRQIMVYKFRTMFPYAEFLQTYVSQNNFYKSGEIKTDFRITKIGKLLRKYWLDEIPMLYNLIRGDLKLVGVRPLSEHYLSLYSKELREQRLKTKPGLLPPFYADMPTTLDEIFNSEERYLSEYVKNPIKTDLKYLFKIISNILSS
ncbi:MAG: sugar transferase [Ignavibacteriales bacterium]|nr:sugar transferase [Ignavibacteriales bacterium]